MRLPNIRTFVLQSVTITSRKNSDNSKVLLVILKYITAERQANIDLQKLAKYVFHINIK